MHLDFENLSVAVFWINDVVLREAYVLGRNVAGIAIQLHKVGGAQSGRGQKIVEGARGRPIAFVANGLVGDDREVVKLGFQAKFVEKVDFDFHSEEDVGSAWADR